jgi:hypothetical protein
LFQIRFEPRRPTLCQPGPHVSAPLDRLITLSPSPSHPGRYHRAPPRPGHARQPHSLALLRRPRSPPSPVHVATTPCQAPLSSFSHLHADASTPTPPLFSLSVPCHRDAFQNKRRPSSRPRFIPSPLIHAQATRTTCRLPEPTFL